MALVWTLVCCLVVVAAIFAFIWRGLEERGMAVLSAIVLVLIVVGVGTLEYYEQYYNERTLRCFVEDKDRGANDGGYHVYTRECGVLVNDDAWFRGKTDSADIWVQIEVGKTYTFRVVGARFPAFSNFPNILEVSAAS